eukprot:TRINITY_DN15074_c0_g1_i1.p1 TRINITY_DN15074_c0_g1~~TRINITY_DN15074_c0_g1_i1.p1  ORF type:complete len:152 (-),score=26.89 TRINITY_DN15074_c0_g1_i1:137-544(-)
MVDREEEYTEKCTRAIRTAEQFSELFYKKLDKERHTIDKMYLPTATLAWNGNAVDGLDNIKRFLLDRLPKSSHTIHNLDSQPVADSAVGGQTTVLVQVSGNVRYDANPSVPFQQNFLLTDSDSKWKVAVDNFRTQ